jgi:hypothetical protein
MKINSGSVLKILVSYLLVYFIAVVFAQAQSFPYKLISKQLDTYFEELELNWHSEGYWGQALNQKDNRYNEAILFYAYQQGTNALDTLVFYKIKKAIHFSFRNLQNENGAMLQQNIPTHVRTALFLEAIAKAASRYPALLKDDKIKKGILKATAWLQTPHNFATNHNLATLLALHSLSELYLDPIFKDLYKKYRTLLLNSFIPTAENQGYWPEAPKTWSNRLNKPYLMVQSMFLKAYLMQQEDWEMEQLHRKLNTFILSNLDLKKCMINIKNSLGRFKTGETAIPVSCASFFWMQPGVEILNKRKKKKILKLCLAHFDDSSKEFPVLLYTDLYYRFVLGIIKKQNR